MLSNIRPSMLYFRRQYSKKLFVISIALSSLATLLISLACIYVFFEDSAVLLHTFLQEGPPPPLYPEYRQLERALPQHDLTLPEPEGQHGKYLYIANHVWGLGWGNVLQEMIYNAYLTEQTGRGFVYDDYVWRKGRSRYSRFRGHLIPSRIPSSALLSGPIVGTRLGDNYTVPRAITKEFWETVCPHPTRITTNMIVEKGLQYSGTAAQLTGTVVDYIQKIEDRCVEITQSSVRIFDFYVFGDAVRSLDIWPMLVPSPVLSQFGWSPLIESAFDINREVISPALQFEEPLSSSTALQGSERYSPIPGLLAVHIRRGDYEQHCVFLETYHSSWHGFNSFPQIPEHFDAPSQEDAMAHKLYYSRHCYPSIVDIAARVRRVRRSAAGKSLTDLYVMTNGHVPWLEELKLALQGTGEWRSISTSRDLTLDWEQKHVSQAVDMLIGQRAEFFIGNGWSSMSGIVTMLRMAYDRDPQTVGFW